MMTSDQVSVERTLAERAARSDPRNVGALVRLAEASLQRGERLGALEMARVAVDVAPSDFRARRFLSGVLSITGSVEEAIDVASAALRINPRNAEARLHLGGLLVSTGQWRRAADQLVQYVEHPGATSTGWRLLSIALQESGRTEKAIEAIEHAIAITPENVEYQVHLASLLSHQGRFGDAMDLLERALLIAPQDPRIFRARSGIHSALLNGEAAFEDAKHALSLNPSDPHSLRHLSQISSSFGGSERERTGQERGLDYWAPRSRRSTPVRPREDPVPLGRLFQLQVRIVAALILREMRTRFGRSRLGYVWAIFEPISHLLTLGSVFSLMNHSPPPVGDSLFLFYLTGLLPFLMFGHVSQEVMTSLSANGVLLQLAVIKRVDVIWARALLHLATEILVGIIVFSAFALFGGEGVPANMLIVVQSLLCMWLMATGIGVTNIVLSELISSWDTFYAAINRLMYFASGIYYSPISMPENVRDALAWNPVLQCIEWFRSGFFRQYNPHWLDRGYAVTWAIGALLVGFAAERAFRRRLRIRT